MTGTAVERMTRIAGVTVGDPGPAAAALFDLRFDLFFRPAAPPAARALWAFLMWVVRRRTVTAYELDPLPLSGQRAVVVLTTHAHPYLPLDANLRTLFRLASERSGAPAPVVGIRRVRVQLPFQTAARYAVTGLGLAVQMARRTHAAGAVPRWAAVREALGRFEVVAGYLHNQRRVTELVRSAAAVVTIDENWMPYSQTLRAADRVGVPTAHYPHGVIGDVVRPLTARYQLFWTEPMARTFGGGSARALEVGYAHGYRGTPPPAIPIGYDVLITSQYHGYRLRLTDAPDDLRDSLLVWRDVLAASLTLRCVVKLHPGDAPEDRAELRAIFAGLEDRVLILGGDVDFDWLMASCRVHGTVSSGSLFGAARLGKPTFVYGTPRLVRENVPFPVRSFRTAAELSAALAELPPAGTALTPTGESPALPWFDDRWIEGRFAAAYRAMIPEAAGPAGKGNGSDA